MRAVVVGGLLWSALAMAGCSSRNPAPVTPSPVTPSPVTRAAEPSAASSGNFDFYLLNLSWSPEYCHSHPSTTECTQHRSFVLHGLWPENTDASYPENCSKASGPADPSQYKDLYPDAGLLQHEWTTHGTCSGLGPDDYFAKVRSALGSITIPPAFQQPSRQQSFSPAQIQGMFADSNHGLPTSSVRVSCGNNFLTAVEICLDKGLKPTSCGAVRSCKANSVKVPPPS